MTDDNHGPQYDKRMKSVGRKVDLLDRIAELEAEVERLRGIESEARYQDMRCKAYNEQFLKDKDEKAALRTQLAEAREALEWYAEFDCEGTAGDEGPMNLGDKARAILAKLEGGQGDNNKR